MKQLNNKYYTSGCGSSNGNFLEPLGFSHTNDIEEAGVIVFGGGADIEPGTYGEEAGPHTYTSPGREKVEIADFKDGLRLGKKFLGICRGNQLMCALAGGKLIQDVSGHGGNHHIMTTFDGLDMKTNSIHHQMVNPYAIKNKKDYKILAWSKHRLSDHYLGPRNKSILLPWDFKEIESIYFPRINAIGYQYHPEMMFGSRGRDVEPVMTWTQKTFMQFFNNEL